MSELLLEVVVAQIIFNSLLEALFLQKLVDVWAPIGILAEQLLNNGPQLVRVKGWQLGVLASNDLHGQHVNVGAVEWWLESGHLEEEHS